jgi:hypothetical protein
VTADAFADLSRGELLERLEVLNAALARKGVMPELTSAEAAAMPVDNLAAMVAMTADRVVTVTRAMGGTP